MNNHYFRPYFHRYNNYPGQSLSDHEYKLESIVVLIS